MIVTVIVTITITVKFVFERIKTSFKNKHPFPWVCISFILIGISVTASLYVKRFNEE